MQGREVQDINANVIWIYLISHLLNGNNWLMWLSAYITWHTEAESLDPRNFLDKIHPRSDWNLNQWEKQSLRCRAISGGSTSLRAHSRPLHMLQWPTMPTLSSDKNDAPPISHDLQTCFLIQILSVNQPLLSSSLCKTTNTEVTTLLG